MGRPQPIRWKPKNPQKYLGDYNNIWARSSWEVRVMNWFDRNPDVIEWGSEELVIPYISPVDNRPHRYFPDFFVKVKTKEGKIKTMVVEVKPDRETKEPKKKERITKQYINEVVTYGVNQAKWKYAEEYCLDRGWEFKVLTEKHLGI
jgi:hypothetical protein